MLKTLAILALLAAYGCALTAPAGNKELLEDISRDRSGQQRIQSEHFMGKPIFLKVRAYPRIKGGSIYGKHWILVKIGNEKIDFSPLLNDISSER